ncbi:hypothetical protein FZI91_12530 [Mycobacterium sp. CBMA271]|uniref:hypothetical protein n=1 Tax=unclassified Mycobacteroides TaxID=2618759 RepID=UPI0012DEFC40|nr:MULTISPECIES: hypothetical protein [unclassified Mycobacteroides]MUM15981.1 hypothetical protein [Mycobacteroides sp. CBMA 326]MUM22520.1 hypothetical protein [Mycobacteroides sp. CBMA 271]
MKWLVAGSLLVVILTEALMAASPARAFALPITGAVVAVALYLLWREARRPHASKPLAAATLSADETLQRSLARTEARVSWAERTRGDWDRHIRPLIAADFSTAMGQHQSKDPAALAATGRMTFGPELWPWVDPNGASFADQAEPAPGRAVLQSILERLEKM